MLEYATSVLLPDMQRVAWQIDSGILDDMLLADLAWAMDRVAVETRCLNREDAIAVQPCVQDYLVPCDDLLVRGVSRVRVGRLELHPSPAHPDDLNSNEYRYDIASRVIHLPRRCLARAVAAPTACTLLCYTVELTTLPNACKIPAVMYEDSLLREAVLALALARTTELHNAPKAAHWHSRARAAITNAVTARVLTASGGAPARMRSNYIAR
jgi:hypothetical protein